MGGGACDERVAEHARRVGALVAREGWALLTGGRDAGVMAAASRGASEAGGLVIGVLPDADISSAAAHVDVPILTGMGDARNAINVLSSRVVIALPGLAGTLSEVALALAANRPVVTLDFDPGPAFASYVESGCLVAVTTPEEAIAAVSRLLAEDSAYWRRSE